MWEYQENISVQYSTASASIPKVKSELNIGPKEQYCTAPDSTTFRDEEDASRVMKSDAQAGLHNYPASYMNVDENDRMNNQEQNLYSGSPLEDKEEPHLKHECKGSAHEPVRPHIREWAV